MPRILFTIIIAALLVSAGEVSLAMDDELPARLPLLGLAILAGVVMFWGSQDR